MGTRTVGSILVMQKHHFISAVLYKFRASEPAVVQSELRSRKHGGVQPEPEHHPAVFQFSDKIKQVHRLSADHSTPHSGKFLHFCCWKGSIFAADKSFYWLVIFTFISEFQGCHQH